MRHSTDSGKKIIFQKIKSSIHFSTTVEAKVLLRKRCARLLWKNILVNKNKFWLFSDHRRRKPRLSLKNLHFHFEKWDIKVNKITGTIFRKTRDETFRSVARIQDWIRDSLFVQINLKSNRSVAFTPKTTLLFVVHLDWNLMSFSWPHFMNIPFYDHFFVWGVTAVSFVFLITVHSSILTWFKTRIKYTLIRCVKLYKKSYRNQKNTNKQTNKRKINKQIKQRN